MSSVTGLAEQGMPKDNHASASNHPQAVRLSYKFQRLRERLRQAVASGELAGKLPGERQLARKYRVNAKTLSKALTDLAAEGLLDRSIGRGTFVRGSEPSIPSQPERWLIVCDTDQLASPLIRLLTQQNPSAQVVTETTSLRPSFLNTFAAVIDLARQTPEAVLRDLVVRNMNVLLVGREPATYSMHAVVVDAALAASCLARDLLLGGHRHLLGVTAPGSVMAHAIRQSIARYAPQATLDIVLPHEVTAGVEQGATAILCDSTAHADHVRRVLERDSFSVPERVSICAIGTMHGNAPCDGYFITPEQELQAIGEILRDTSPRRPTTLWLTGVHQRVGTTSPLLCPIDPDPDLARMADLSV
jgi:DNA-binding transcriptional regulator YhcF (GntR family)